MKHFVFILIFLALLNNLLLSQLVYHQDCFHGGVSGGGFSTGMGVGSGALPLHVELGSTIRKGYLFVYTYLDIESGSVKINNSDFFLEQFQELISLIHIHSPVSPSKTYVLDITDWLIQANTDLFTLETVMHPEMPFGGVFAPYLYIEYDKPSLPEISTTIVINNQNISGLNSFQLSNLNPINSIFPVGFTLYTDRHSYLQNERTRVYFNDNYLGLVYGSDAVNQPWTGGVKGHFYYQDNQLIGLDDDVPNNTMNESDALADVSPYIGNLSTSVSIELRQIIFPVVPTAAINSYLAYFLTYTSPCQPFEATLLTSDTTTCSNFPVQLGVTVPDTINATHEWLPQTNLSCYDCPNPVFIGNSTTNYTVRIWASDSCSKVLPVRVRVLPEPSFESIEITESVCGGATGTITARSLSGVEAPHVFSINGGAPQNNGNFTNLAAGAYTVTVTNAVGCSRDSVVVVGEYNNVQAAFSVNPTTGTAPLDISINNQSQNATEYFWNFSDEDGTALHQGAGSLSAVEAPLAGLYTITLIAGNGTPHCNDTTSIQIFVYDSLQVVIPNVFTPNNDGSNDWFGITTNIPISAKIVLLNRWGNVLVEKSFTTQANIFEPIWDGLDAAEGVYFYRIYDIQGEVGQGLVLDKEGDFQGFVHLVR